MRVERSIEATWMYHPSFGQNIVELLSEELIDLVSKKLEQMDAFCYDKLIDKKLNTEKYEQVIKQHILELDTKFDQVWVIIILWSKLKEVSIAKIYVTPNEDDIQMLTGQFEKLIKEQTIH